MADGVFRRGDLRLFLLGALEDGSKHGYELIRLLEDRFAGLYRPSAGSIYPRLGALVAAGLVAHEGRDYALTDAGQAEVDDRREELGALERSIGARRGRQGSHALRAEVRAAAAEVRAQQRRVNRAQRTQPSTRSASLDTLRLELRVFAADVLVATRRVDPDPDVVAAVMQALEDARAAVLRALATDGA
ncbi:MAG TPA: PadR family transcriptional regulator [Acidimicrobiales bacterium]|nr:PadR family transcriptional regulator [Acidimicrobiales bacterium]